MKILRWTKLAEYNGQKAVVDGSAAIATGNFDGVHRGHQLLLKRLLAGSEQYKIVATFSAGGQRLKKCLPQNNLTSLTMKLAIFDSLGVDTAIIIDFDPSFSARRCGDYYRLLLNHFPLKRVVVGHEHRCGSDQLDSDGLTRELSCHSIGIEVVIPLLLADGRRISSSLLRRHLAAGDLETLENLLGRPYSINLPEPQRWHKNTARNDCPDDVCCYSIERDKLRQQLPPSTAYDGLIINANGGTPAKLYIEKNRITLCCHPRPAAWQQFIFNSHRSAVCRPHYKLQ